MVAFFHIIMHPVHANLPFVVELITVVGAIATIPYIEAARENRNILLEFHWIIGIIYQKLTAGVILPIYWALFIVTGAAILHHTPQAANNSKIDQKHAESIIFALALGYAVPSVTMLIAFEPNATALWQGFPLLMRVSQLLYHCIRPPSRASAPSTVNAIYIALFLFSALPHLIFTALIFLSPNPSSVLKSLFIPSVALLNPDSTTIDQGVVNFIKWDYVMILFGAFVVTVWVAGRSVKGIVGLTAWWVVSVPLFGAGASVVGVFWWRERLLNEARKEEEMQVEQRIQ
jgi:hypothetical protein